MNEHEWLISVHAVSARVFFLSKDYGLKSLSLPSKPRSVRLLCGRVTLDKYRVRADAPMQMNVFMSWRGTHSCARELNPAPEKV